MRISLNKILRIINIGILITTWYLFNELGGNYYINLTTIILGTILGIETHLFLIYADKKKNSLLFILSFILVIYFLFRIPTLLFTTFSVVFLRFTISYLDSNFALLFIIISNIFLFLGIHIATIRNKNIPIKLQKDKPSKDYKIILVIILPYFLTFSYLLKIDSITKLFGFIQNVFLNPATIIFMCIIYFSYYYNNFRNKTKVVFILLLVLYIVMVSLNGSRSGLQTIGVFFIIASIVIFNKISFKIIHIIGIILFIPVAVIIFFVSSYTRTISDESSLNYLDKIENTKSFDFDAISDDKMVYAPIFDRMGFFDYATEIIAHEKEYSDIFRLNYYLASIVDNVLTPGFNIFNTPRVSNALIYRYSNSAKLSMKNVSESYHSDQLTIYGEFYSLFFGWGSLIIFFFTGYIFQKFYDKKNRLGGCKTAIQKGLILLVFFQLINSFGLDWLLFDIVSFYICYIIFQKLLFKNRRNYTKIIVT